MGGISISCNRSYPIAKRAVQFRKTAKETQNIIESILYAEDDQQEKIQFDLDMLEDRERIAPMAVGTSGFVVAAFEVVAKHETLKLAEKYKHKILGP